MTQKGSHANMNIAKMAAEWVAVCVGCNNRRRIWAEGGKGETYCKDCGEALYR